MPKIKILFFINCLTSGGTERRLVELMKVLNLNKDFELELVLMSKEVHYREIFDMNIRINYLIRSTKKDFSIFNQFYKICKMFKPGIVHCWDSMTSIYAIYACKLLHTKLLNGMVTNTPRKKTIFNRYWLRGQITFPFSDYIIGNSIAGLKAYNAPLKKSLCIYNGYNFERSINITNQEIIRKHLQINKKYIIGMVAEFSQKKDYKTYFHSAQIILEKRDDIVFLAIGKNTDSDISKDLIDSKFMDNFRLLGEKSNIESLIGMMDIGILATFNEGVSNSILEYMALGKPVIASIGGGTNEIIEEGKTGFLIPQSNPQILAEKIEVLLHNDGLRKKMGLLGQERIKNEFSIDIMVNKYISIYNSILNTDTNSLKN
jgi:glycosyltransferase involved in cell wall biosynthesis